jgi:hypothetical protein
LEIMVSFCSGQPGPLSFCFTLPAIAEMTGAHNDTQLFSFEMGSHEHFCQGWPQTMIYPISASEIARITGMSH